MCFRNLFPRPDAGTLCPPESAAEPRPGLDPHGGDGRYARRMRIEPATQDHFAAILALNEEFVEVLAPLTRERLELLHARASYHRVAIDQHGVAGFVLAFGSGARHDSVNYRWFAARYPSFLYVDRVVVSSRCQCNGVGSLLYEDLFAFARREGYAQVTCEIDTDPPNPRSERFHDRFGFEEVGSQQVEYETGTPIRVSLRSVQLAYG
jgi:uncharacterized protein